MTFFGNRVFVDIINNGDIILNYGASSTQQLVFHKITRGHKALVADHMTTEVETEMMHTSQEMSKTVRSHKKIQETNKNLTQLVTCPCQHFHYEFLASKPWENNFCSFKHQKYDNLL